MQEHDYKENTESGKNGNIHRGARNLDVSFSKTHFVYTGCFKQHLKCF